MKERDLYRVVVAVRDDKDVDTVHRLYVEAPGEDFAEQAALADLIARAFALGAVGAHEEPSKNAYRVLSVVRGRFEADSEERARIRELERTVATLQDELVRARREAM